jgi:ribonucleotide monophosphatase NagD (HAD superfamily)
MLTWDASDLDNPRLTALPGEFLEQCGHVELATSVEDANVLLLHGSEVWYKGEDLADQSLAPYISTGQTDSVDPILQACSERNLPMVCANPDNIVRTADGGAAHMPGTLAERYRQLVATDVDCRVFGKPHTEHFVACLDRLREQAGIPADRVAHVGDSLHHDIAGADATGIASIWITSSGIHANELGLDFGDLPTEEQIDALLTQEGTPAPTHVLSTFSL